MAEPDKIKLCDNRQMLGDFNICLLRQVSCKRLVDNGQCPQGYCAEDEPDKEQ